MNASIRLSTCLLAGLSLAGLSLAGCSADSTTNPFAPPGLELSFAQSTVTIPVADTITPADKMQLGLRATSMHNPITTPKGVVWESSDPTVATVDTLGVVTAVHVGTTEITARINSTRAAATIVVAYKATRVTVTPSTIVGLVGDTLTITASALDASGALVPGIVYTFAATDPTAATVTRTGPRTARVTFLKTGSVTITTVAAGQTITLTTNVQPRDFIGAIASAAPSGALTISAGADATCGILPLGRGYCFGRAPLIGIAKDTSCFDDSGNTGTISCTLVPLRIAGALNLTSVSVGDSTVACGTTADSRAFCWGEQSFGQLGNGVASPGSSAVPALVVASPTRSAMPIMRVAAGGFHACGLTPAGSAYCWGQDSLYQLGGGDARRVNSTTPIPVSGGQIFTAITAGHAHTCALRADGAAFCWGDNRNGQLGLGGAADTVDVVSPVTGGLAFSVVSAGGNHTCGITRPSGAVFCWGRNEFGQLGRGSTDGSNVPVAIAGNLTFKSISAGFSTTCGITTIGTAVCWGRNNYGQVGDGTSQNIRTTPTPVTQGRTDFVAVTVGKRHTCAVAADGAYCWGSNMVGALGNELQALSQPFPTKTAPPQQ